MRHTSIKSHIRVPRRAIAGLSATTLAFGGLGLAAVASTLPNSDVLDIEAYEDCLRHIDPCCDDAGGVSSGKDCAAPSGKAPASRHDPSDIGTETFTPVYTPTPPPPQPSTTQAPPPQPCQSPEDPNCRLSNG
jgi:hypothetical protein